MFQVLLAGALVVLASLDPAADLAQFANVALIDRVTLSATQDIAIDAYNADLSRR